MLVQNENYKSTVSLSKNVGLETAADNKTPLLMKGLKQTTTKKTL